MRREKAIIWTQQLVAKEFGMDSRTVGKRFRAAGLKPDAKGYTTQEVVQAIYGDYAGERLRKMRAEADAIELKNAQAREELIPADQVESRWVNIAASVKTRLLTIGPKMEGRHGAEVGADVDREVREALAELSEKE